jgi:hypothetical protein
MNRVPLFPRSRVTLIIVGIGFVVSHAGERAGARDDRNVKPKPQGMTALDGAWRLVRSKDPRTGQMRGMPPGVEMTKLLVGGQYAWTVVREGTALGGAGGKYKVDDKTYSETVVYSVGENMLPLVGRACPFTWTIEGGKWHHKGTLKVGSIKQEVDEIWEPVP